MLIYLSKPLLTVNTFLVILNMWQVVLYLFSSLKHVICCLILTQTFVSSYLYIPVQVIKKKISLNGKCYVSPNLKSILF